ncbi:MAG: glucuronate isomerase [Planctomycetaceae bacterium]|jgi:glucuronate isomerase|nr:glucuronate isomerase [Planctomycetaceae bacterium]
MSRFIHENFLLQNPAAIRLYHEYAAEMPIIDYHCHLPPRDIAENRQFENLTQIWLAGDHYKWRAMRAAGVDEKYITGGASDWEKFAVWASVVPKTLRNPLYHWTHLELNRPFGINDRLLSPDTAKSIWDECNAKLRTPEFSARGIMRQMDVKLVCTTDDPADSLEWHRKIAADESFDIQVFPTFRPDKALQICVPQPRYPYTEESIKSYNKYLDKLGKAAEVEIKTFDNLLEALAQRHNYFHENGSRLSDHGYTFFSFNEYIDEPWRGSVFAEFENLRQGGDASYELISSMESAVLYHVTQWNSEKEWTTQLHIGAIRNNNSRMYEKLGADAGFDSIVDEDFAVAFSKFLDKLDQNKKLPKTIVYNLNPSANEMLATMIGNFQDGKTPGKMQFGSAWWFLDQKDGMEKQLNCLSNLGLLSQFVGMLTDSRSFLSYTRHEYFRRILCNLLGTEIESGLLPNDFEMLGGMVRDICYNNAKQYFGFETKL